MYSALKADFRGAPRAGFPNPIGEHIEVQEIGPRRAFRLAFAVGKGTERTAISADVGVIDVAIHDEVSVSPVEAQRKRSAVAHRVIGVRAAASIDSPMQGYRGGRSRARECGPRAAKVDPTSRARRCGESRRPEYSASARRAKIFPPVSRPSLSSSTARRMAGSSHLWVPGCIADKGSGAR